VSWNLNFELHFQLSGYLCEQKYELQAHLQIQFLCITWKLISEIFVQNSAFSSFCISRIQNKKTDASMITRSWQHQTHPKRNRLVGQLTQNVPQLKLTTSMRQRMQKELKAEFWTKISEISFQVTRRNWICECACNSCFCSHRHPESWKCSSKFRFQLT